MERANRVSLRELFCSFDAMESMRVAMRRNDSVSTYQARFRRSSSNSSLIAKRLIGIMIREAWGGGGGGGGGSRR